MQRLKDDSFSRSFGSLPSWGVVRFRLRKLASSGFLRYILLLSKRQDHESAPTRVYSRVDVRIFANRASRKGYQRFWRIFIRTQETHQIDIRRTIPSIVESRESWASSSPVSSRLNNDLVIDDWSSLIAAALMSRWIRCQQLSTGTDMHQWS